MRSRDVIDLKKVVFRVLLYSIAKLLFNFVEFIEHVGGSFLLFVRQVFVSTPSQEGNRRCILRLKGESQVLWRYYH